MTLVTVSISRSQHQDGTETMETAVDRQQSCYKVISILWQLYLLLYLTGGPQVSTISPFWFSDLSVVCAVVGEGGVLVVGGGGGCWYGRVVL